MLKIYLSRLLCLTLALQLALPAKKGFATEPAQQRQEVLSKVHELLNHPAAQGAEFRDANKAPLSQEQFLTQNPSEFYMIPSGSLNGAPYAIRVKSTVSSGGDLIVAVAVMDQAFQNTFSRRAVTLNASQSHAQRRVEIERAVNTMVQSLQTTSVKGKNNRSVASDFSGSEIKEMLQRVVMLALVLGVVSTILGLTQTFGPTASTARGRLFTFAFASFLIAYGLDRMASAAEMR